MALPANVGTGIVEFYFSDSNGVPASGSIIFSPEYDVLKNATSSPPVLITPNLYEVILVDGSGSVELIATNDTDLKPTGWTYTVISNLDGGAHFIPFSISVPVGSTTNLASLAPTPWE